MTSGGSARDRRKSRRFVKRVLDTYGLPAKGGTPTKGQGAGEFFRRYLLPAITLAGFAHWVAGVNVVVSSAAYLLSLAVFLRGFWAWCNKSWKTAALLVVAALSLLAFGWYDYNWIREERTPTFLYLVPSRDLIDCDRRAFFVNHSGLNNLQNVEIVIKDNTSGVVQKESYPEIEPGPQNPDAPRYIWVKPSHAWDEAYSIAVTGSKFHSVQETVLRSSNGQLQSAIEIKIDRRKRPVLNCRDRLLPESYVLGQGSRESCDRVMAIDPGLLNNLQPEVHGFQRPNGDYTFVRERKLAPPSDLDSESEDRRLTEYQQQVMRSKLSRYRGIKLLILYAGGPRTLAYATEFGDFFHSLQWRVDGPNLVPVGNERIVDLQVSMSNLYWNKSNPAVTDLLSSLEGVKHRQRGVYDGAIAPDLIVLWVGPKSPSSFRPDDCAPAELRPKPGEPDTCEMVAAATGVCPFPPK